MAVKPLKKSAMLTVIGTAALFGVSLTVSCSSQDSEKNNNTVITDTSTTSSTNTTKKSGDPDEGRISATEVQEKILCPHSAELSKKGLFWGAPNGWRSFSQSFVNEIVSFVEAQWHGVNVGKMMCVYVGKQKRSFPVVLQNDLLTKMPIGYKWGGLKEGVVKCKSGNLNDCPFFHTKRDVDMEQVYDSLEFKKGKGDELD